MLNKTSATVKPALFSRGQRDEAELDYFAEQVVRDAIGDDDTPGAAEKRRQQRWFGAHVCGQLSAISIGKEEPTEADVAAVRDTLGPRLQFLVDWTLVVIGSRPGHAPLLFTRFPSSRDIVATCLARRGELQRAESALDGPIVGVEQAVRRRFLLARLHAASGRSKLAERLLLEGSQALGRRRDRALCTEYCWMLVREGRIREAVLRASEYAKTWPRHPPLHAISSLFSENREARTASAEKAIDAAPRTGLAWLLAARAMLDSGDVFENLDYAQRCLDHAAQLAPLNGDVFIELVRVRVLRLRGWCPVDDLAARCAPGMSGIVWSYLTRTGPLPPQVVLSMARESVLAQLSASLAQFQRIAIPAALVFWEHLATARASIALEVIFGSLAERTLGTLDMRSLAPF